MRGRVSGVILRPSMNKTFSLYTFLRLKERIALGNVRLVAHPHGAHSSWRYFSLELGELRKSCLHPLRVATGSKTFDGGSQRNLLSSSGTGRICTQGKLKAEVSCWGLPHCMCFSPCFLRKDFLMMKSIGLFPARVIFSVFSEQKKRDIETQVF